MPLTFVERQKLVDSLADPNVTVDKDTVRRLVVDLDYVFGALMIAVAQLQLHVDGYVGVLGRTKEVYPALRRIVEFDNEGCDD